MSRLRLSLIAIFCLIYAGETHAAEDLFCEANKLVCQARDVLAKSGTELDALFRVQGACSSTSPTYKRIIAEYSRFTTAADIFGTYVKNATLLSGVDPGGAKLAELRLQIADSALAAHCLDIADDQYSQVVKDVPYESYRDRARKGLAEVSADKEKRFH